MAVRLAMLLLITAASALPGNPEPVTVRRGEGRVDVLVGGRPFTAYYFGAGAAKPFLFPLRSAAGTIATRAFPMEDIPGEDHDEPHQRSMYFAHGDINGYDFWGEAEFPRWSRHSAVSFGRTVVRKLEDVRSGVDYGTLRARFDLLTSGGNAVAAETQSYTFSGDEHVRIVDCEFTIQADHGPVRMGDTKEGTFAVRLVKDLEPPAGHIINSEGAAGEKAIWGRRADWVDFYGRVAGEDVGLAIFDHPENLRHPTYWHARRYGLLAANPFGMKEFLRDRHQDGSYVIPAGGSLTLRYRVLVHHGDFREARVADAYRLYANRK